MSINRLNASVGRTFALFQHAMILFRSKQAPRRKAVWGPKRTVAIGVGLLILALAPHADAEGRHRRSGERKQSGVRSARVKDYRIDDELSKRSSDRDRSTQTTRVIVTLDPINALVLDLPNGLVKQLAASPAVARIQYDRPIATHNYRTAVTVGSRSVQEY